MEFSAAIIDMRRWMYMRLALEHIEPGCRAGRYNRVVTALSKNEERLVAAVRALPPEAADHVITWATQLLDLAGGKNVDWSPAWSEEDLADARRASLARFDERECEKP